MMLRRSWKSIRVKSAFPVHDNAWIYFSDELETSDDLMWIVLSATSRLVRDRPGREESRELKRRN